MQIKIFRVTGRLRLGPGDTVMLSDKETISELQQMGVIEAEPMQELDVQPTKRKKAEEE
jgi:hypothetical protein